MSPTPPAWSRWIWVTTIVARSAGSIPECGKCIDHDWSREGSARFDQAGPRTSNQVTRGDAGVPAHLGIDREDVIPQGLDDRIGVLHRCILTWNSIHR